MTIGNFLFGRPGGIETYPALEQDQRQLVEGITQQLARILPNYLGSADEDFETYAAPFRRDFLQRTLPDVENRYSQVLGDGTNYEQSSGFGLGLRDALTDFNTNLASRRIAMRNEDFQRLMQLFAPALQGRQYVYNRPTETGFIENALLAFISNLGKAASAAGTAASGGATAAIG